jgi:hypothetical protein
MRWITAWRSKVLDCLVSAQRSNAAANADRRSPKIDARAKSAACSHARHQLMRDDSTSAPRRIDFEKAAALPPHGQ